MEIRHFLEVGFRSIWKVGWNWKSAEFKNEFGSWKKILSNLEIGGIQKRIAKRFCRIWKVGGIQKRIEKRFCRNEIRKWFHKIKYHKKILSKGEIQALKLSNEKRTPAERVKGGEIAIRGTKWGACKRRVCSSDFNFGGSLFVELWRMKRSLRSKNN